MPPLTAWPPAPSSGAISCSKCRATSSWKRWVRGSWGLLSGATAFCVGPWIFLTMRFLLGLAEAGRFPGMILFFTFWFPDWHRARIVSAFMVALPVAVATGTPGSTALHALHGLFGLARWKGLSLFEA